MTSSKLTKAGSFHSQEKANKIKIKGKEGVNKMVSVDRKVIDMISHVSREERNAILKMLDVSRAEPQMKLILAIFRDVYMFKEMSQAMLLRYQSKIGELDARIVELENIKED